MPDLSHIIDAEFEEIKEEDDSWLDEIINKEEEPEPSHKEKAKDEIEDTIKRLGIGGK